MFDPGFSGSFAQPIPANVLSLVRAKIVDALAWAHAGITDGVDPNPLPPFVEYALAIPSEPSPPSISVFRRRTTKIERASEQHWLVSSTAEFSISIGLVGAKAGLLMSDLECYVRAVDAIVRTASDAEMLAGFPGGTLATWDVSEHVYGPDVPEGDTHARAAALTLVVEPLEA